MADDRSTLNVSLILFGVIISTMFVLLNIYKPQALIALICLYLVIYSVMVLIFLNNHEKVLNNNSHYDINWYASIYNVFLGVTMFAMYFFLTRQNRYIY